MMKKLLSVAIACFLLTAAISCRDQKNLQEYRGVITLHLLPAKIMKVNRIIKDPKPGTSNISDEGILVEVDENPDVIANWTVVDIKYYKYQKPKVIKYEILGEKSEITVNYHAVRVVIDGDMSKYVQEQ
jgi:hypothetical protein